MIAMQAAEFLVMAVEYYFFAGAAVAVLFLLFGVERVEPGSKGSFAFRALLVPGLCMLWPLVLWRWYVLHTADSGEQS